jgi:hypothetical protein
LVLSNSFTSKQDMANKPIISVSIVQVPVPEQNPIKSFVAKVLGLPPSLNSAWDVSDIYPKDIDATPQLALAHYNEEYDPYNRLHEPLRRVRGIIVDLNTGAVVCDSYGHTQTLPCYEPLTVDTTSSVPEGVMQVSTEIAMYINTVDVAPEETAKINFGLRSFDRSTTKLFLGYEGAMVRIFKWNGQVFFSTHRRIDASSSNWGGRTKFSTIYKDLGGPEPASFFGEEQYSPYCYMLLIAHNDIRLASSTSDNRIIFIGMKKVWDEAIYAGEGKPYTWSGKFQVHMPPYGKVGSTFSNNHNHSLIIQPCVDVETANKFLFPNELAKDIPPNDYQAKEHEIVVEYGEGNNAVNEVFFKRSSQNIADERLAGGDFVIIYTQTPEGQTVVYRLESPAFEYRVNITANDPNLYHRFVLEMVNFTKANSKDLIDQYPKYIGDDNNDLSLNTAIDRQRYWWSLFYDAAAPAYKDEVEEFYKRYNSDIDKVSNFILTEYLELMKSAAPQGEEMKRINSKTRRRIEDIRKIATGNRVNGQSPFTIIRNLLYKETGASFYQMITTVKNLDKLKAVQAKDQQTAVNITN